MTPAARFPSRLAPLLGRAGLALGVAGAVFGLSGCSVLSRRTPQPEPAPLWGPPTHREVGRILDYDAAAGTALVEIPAHLPVPSDLAGVALVVRNPDTLEPTARVVVSPHRAGRIFGVYVIEGRPAPEDEVARPPETFP
jgi:hypothetical protein